MREEKKGISRHLENVKDDFRGDFRGGIAGQYATPSELARDDSRYFGKEGKGVEKTCPQQGKKFEDFATIAPSDEELQYFCPLCDTLVAREYDDNGTRRTDIYDADHLAG